MPPHAVYDPQRHQTDPLLSLNNESMSQRFNSSMDTVESKSAFRILETAGRSAFDILDRIEVPNLQPKGHMRPFMASYAVHKPLE